MDYRKIGKTNLVPSAIGIGCNKIAALSRDRAEVVATLNEALDQGINFFDTADNYSYGDSEALLGDVIRGRRDQAIICTKAGHTRGHARHFGKYAIPVVKKLARRLKPLRNVATSTAGAIPGGRNYEPDYVTKSIEQSLHRLKTDYLDLFFIHGPSPKDVADGALFDTLERLKDKGMIRHYGVSCTRWASTADVATLLDHKGLAALQISLNPYNMDPLCMAREKAAEHDVGLVARDIFFKGDLLADAILGPMLAKDPTRSQAQTALRFALQENPEGPVIVGVSNREHLDDLVGALSAAPLTSDEIQKLSALGQKNRPIKPD